MRINKHFLYSRMNCIDNKQSKVYNNDKEIVNTVDTYTYKVCDGDLNNSGNRKKLTFKYFVGMDTIGEVLTQKEDKIKINFNSNIEKGDFKAVLITPDNKIINIVEGSNKGSKTILLKKGKSRIKLVGRKASGSINIYTESSSNNKIKFYD